MQACIIQHTNDSYQQADRLVDQRGYSECLTAAKQHNEGRGRTGSFDLAGSDSCNMQVSVWALLQLVLQVQVDAQVLHIVTEFSTAKLTRAF